MTILVGVLCKDGVVIGADSSATFGAGNLRTIEQPIQKIDIVANQIIVAGTGQIGLGQRFVHQVGTAWNNNALKGEPIEACKTMSKLGIDDFAQTSAPRGEYGALVAFPLKNKLNLCEFSTRDFQPELKSDRLWYVSMGSGQLIVDPFLGLMRKVFWKDGPPAHQDAVFAVTWALQHAIELNPGGVNGPIRIAVLSKDPKTGNITARLLDSSEISEHIENVAAAEAYLGRYAESLSGSGKEGVPDIPKP